MKGEDEERVQPARRKLPYADARYTIEHRDVPLRVAVLLQQVVAQAKVVTLLEGRMPFIKRTPRVPPHLRT